MPSLYEVQRNALIPTAQFEAMKFLRENGIKPSIAAQDKSFHDQMNRLAYKHGLVNYYKPAKWPNLKAA